MSFKTLTVLTTTRTQYYNQSSVIKIGCSSKGSFEFVE